MLHACSAFILQYAISCVHSSFANILKRKRELVVLLLLSYGCLVTVNVPWLFIGVRWVGLQCVITVFPVTLTYHFILLLPLEKI